MQEDKKLKRFELHAVPVLQSSWNATGSSFGTGTHINILKSKWDSVISSANFTKWTDCDQTKFTSNPDFDASPTPIGYTTSPIAGWLIAIPEAVSATATLIVQGDPSNYGTAEPPYGMLTDITASTNCTVSQYAPNGNILRECTGWIADSVDPETLDVTSTANGSTRLYNFVVTGNEYVRLTWNWEIVGRQVAISKIPADCSITTNTVATLEGYYPIGTTVSYTAVGADFVKWSGAPAEVADVTARTISFTIGSSAITLTPCFKRNWTYDSSTHKISNGYAVFGVTEGEDNRLTISSLTTVGAMDECDFDLPVTDGVGNRYTLVAIGAANGLFYHNNAYKSLNLPSTLESVVNYAFESCGQMSITLPTNNAVKTLGGSSFVSSGICGKIVLTNCTSIGANAFKQTNISSVELGEGVTSVGTATFYKNGSLWKFVSHAKTLSLGERCLEQCVNLREIHLNCYPTFGSYWKSSTPLGTTSRVFAPLNRPGWKEVIAAQSFTKWKGCDPLQKKDYTDTFGLDAVTPYGLMTSPFTSFLVNTGSFGTYLIVH